MLRIAGGEDVSDQVEHFVPVQAVDKTQRHQRDRRNLAAFDVGVADLLGSGRIRRDLDDAVFFADDAASWFAGF